jgi:hypothetical protein
MQEIRNVVTFQAPHYLGEDISSTAGLFEAEAHLSQFLAAQLSNSGLVVGRAIKEMKCYSIARKVEVADRTFWVDVSHDRSLGDWTVVITENGIISRLLKRTDSRKGERLRELVDQSLKKDERITKIEWRTVDEWLQDCKTKRSNAST